MHNSLQRIAKRAVLFTLAVLLLAITCHAQAIAPVITVEHGPNAPQQLSKPYVILVSLDGFRYDYAKRYHADHLLALAADGASAPEGMLPSYPTITFPNHYSIVTGLYPEHHGIVNNDFYDPALKETYSNSMAGEVLADGTWYGGTPLWVLAEQQGMRSASFFWVGCEADIQGVRPTYYLKYDGKFPNGKRVEQVLAWLHLPPEQRPHFITLYFSDTDGAGHRYGPESPQVADAVHELDGEIGKLMEGIKESKLAVDLIVLADHGMVKVEGEPIRLEQYGFNPAWFAHVEGTLLYPKSDDAAQKAYEAMRGKSDKFSVYRRAQVPAYLHFDSSPREGDPVIVPNGPYYLTTATADERVHVPVGYHGFDVTRMPEMKALFVAAGPDIRHGVVLPPFENVNVYPLVARILGLDITKLKTGPIDGKLGELEGILQTK
ncbi:MAG TPA: ectonucleotide pyrophosphatase/phosphodiesterase [Candidatus Dormibacteraeota bacterium]|nr:ectonucleotide pyrophosphatase/phosphodiesterase [Candidatus Dormibacteraeota bacterium]